MLNQFVRCFQLIAGCAKTRDGYTKAQVFLQEMDVRGIKQDSVTYGALINVCASHGLEEEARAIFAEMQRAGVAPNLFHYSALLNTFACKGKHADAEEVLLQIRAAGLTPNLVHQLFAF
jgi:pentatricopeptide repeat protein